MPLRRGAGVAQRSGNQAPDIVDLYRAAFFYIGFDSIKPGAQIRQGNFGRGIRFGNARTPML